MSAHQKVCLITGVSSGIGQALAREMIAKKWIVIGVARSKDKLEMLATELGDAFLSFPCDVSNQENVKSISSFLKEKKIIPELFFLNAGLAGQKALEESINTEHHLKVMSVNYFGVLNWIEEWAEFLKETPTIFVVTSSINAFFSPPGGAAYAASKAAIAKAFESLRRLYLKTPLQFLIVYPGPVDTEGLVGKWPFTWSAQKMAQYMIENAFKGKQHMKSHFFYRVVIRFLNLLPDHIVMKILTK